MELEMLYEVDVYDDGDITVRKIEREPQYCVTMIFHDIDEVKKYLTEWLSVRWPIEDIIKDIEEASLWQWVEFK